MSNFKSAEHIIKEWNKSADEFNQWANLGEDEKIEFAFSLGRDEGIVEALQTHKQVCDSL